MMNDLTLLVWFELHMLSFRTPQAGHKAEVGLEIWEVSRGNFW